MLRTELNSSATENATACRSTSRVLPRASSMTSLAVPHSDRAAL